MRELRHSTKPHAPTRAASAPGATRPLPEARDPDAAETGSAAPYLPEQPSLGWRPLAFPPLPPGLCQCRSRTLRTRPRGRSPSRSRTRVPAGVGPQLAAEGRVADHEADRVGDLLRRDQPAEL